MLKKSDVDKPFDAPSQRNLDTYPHIPNIFRNHSRRPTFLQLTVCVYLHSTHCGGLKTHLFCNRVRTVSAVQVIQGRWFSCQSKACMRLPITFHSEARYYTVVRTMNAFNGKCRFSGSSSSETLGPIFKIHCNYGPIFHRFWDTATYWLKIGYFSYLPFPMFSLEFRCEVNQEDARVMAREDWRPHNRSLGDFDMIPGCDGRQMDGRTERRNQSFIAS